MHPEQVFFADPLPELQSLCVVNISVPPSTTTVHSQQPHVLRCREFIFTEPDILATPALGRENKFTMIMQQSLYKTGKIQGRIKKLGLEMEKPKRVTISQFKDCLNYTLKAKMAPAWNRIGTHLVQGRDFLLTRQKLNAVCMELNMTEEELYIALIADIVRTPGIQLEDLDICRPVMQEFASEPQMVIKEYSIERKWCHVLPSMKKGKVIHVLHKIPEDSPFKSYKDIKRHWKNMYGYRLPEHDEDMLYYQVYFKPIGERLFTYPACCVRPQELQIFPRTDPQPIMEAFLQDLHTRVPRICGQKIEFSQKGKYTYPTLSEATKVEDTDVSNLKNNPPEQKQGFRATTLAAYTGKMTVSPDSTQGQINSHNQQSTVHAAKFPQSFMTQKDLQETHTAQASGVTTMEVDKDKPKFKPTFIPKQSNKVKPGTLPSCTLAGKADRKMPPLVPVFKATCTKPAATRHKQLDLMSRAKQSHESYKDNEVPNPCIYGGTPTLVSSQPASTAPAIYSGHPAPALLSQPETFESKNPTPGSGFESTSVSSITTSRSVSSQGRMKRPLERCHGNEYSSESGNAYQAVSEEKFKKPRNKPLIQEGLDIQALATEGQLWKVNTHTLLAWLKSQGIKCKAKEKKGDLVDKVNQVLHVTSTEQ